MCPCWRRQVKGWWVLATVPQLELASSDLRGRVCSKQPQDVGIYTWNPGCTPQLPPRAEILLLKIAPSCVCLVKLKIAKTDSICSCIHYLYIHERSMYLCADHDHGKSMFSRGWKSLWNCLWKKNMNQVFSWPVHFRMILHIDFSSVKSARVTLLHTQCINISSQGSGYSWNLPYRTRNLWSSTMIHPKLSITHAPTVWHVNKCYVSGAMPRDAPYSQTILFANWFPSPRVLW